MPTFAGILHGAKQQMDAWKALLLFMLDLQFEVYIWPWIFGTCFTAIFVCAGVGGGMLVMAALPAFGGHYYKVYHALEGTKVCDIARI